MAREGGSAFLLKSLGYGLDPADGDDDSNDAGPPVTLVVPRGTAMESIRSGIALAPSQGPAGGDVPSASIASRNHAASVPQPAAPPADRLSQEAATEDKADARVSAMRRSHPVVPARKDLALVPDRSAQLFGEADSTDLAGTHCHATLADYSWPSEDAHFYYQQCLVRASLRVSERRVTFVDHLFRMMNDVGSCFADESLLVLRCPSGADMWAAGLPYLAKRSAIRSAELYCRYDLPHASFWEALLFLLRYYMPGGRVPADLADTLAPQTDEAIRTLLRSMSSRLMLFQGMGSGFEADIRFWKSSISLTTLFLSRRVCRVAHNFMLKDVLLLLRRSLGRASEAADVAASSASLSLQPTLPSLPLAEQVHGALVELQQQQKLAQDDAHSISDGSSSNNSDSDGAGSSTNEDEAPKLAPQQRMPLSRASPYVFSDELSLPDQPPGLKRPRYSNRIHTAYDWNRYNKTHYDSKNPPPKQIVGYKFNIFYPELPPSSKIRYELFTLPSAGEAAAATASATSFVGLRFVACPPYADIAFRILDKEWERNCRRGFRCVFERGVLHLSFSFKKVRYKR